MKKKYIRLQQQRLTSNINKCLFRAYYYEKKVMAKVEAIVFNDPDWKDECPYVNLTYEWNPDDRPKKLIYETHIPLKMVTLMRFTAFYDKNNKEIYEKDILKKEDSEGQIKYFTVIFSGGAFKLQPTHKDIMKMRNKGIIPICTPLKRNTAMEYTVVGNIRENKEVLQ